MFLVYYVASGSEPVGTAFFAAAEPPFMAEFDPDYDGSDLQDLDEMLPVLADEFRRRAGMDERESESSS